MSDDEVRGREAADELIRMTEDMGLYDDGTDDDEGTACNPWPSN